MRLHGLLGFFYFGSSRGVRFFFPFRAVISLNPLALALALSSMSEHKVKGDVLRNMSVAQLAKYIGYGTLVSFSARGKIVVTRVDTLSRRGECEFAWHVLKSLADSWVELYAKCTEAGTMDFKQKGISFHQRCFESPYFVDMDEGSLHTILDWFQGKLVFSHTDIHKLRILRVTAERHRVFMLASQICSYLEPLYRGEKSLGKWAVGCSF